MYRLDRRRLLTFIPVIGLAGCSRSATNGTFTTVDSFGEVALSPDGATCAIHPMSDDPSTILILEHNLDTAAALTFPVKNHWVRDLTFSPDGRCLLFSAASPPFDYRSRLFCLDLESRVLEALETGQDYNRSPTISPNGMKLSFGGRSASGASLSVFEMDRGSGISERLGSVPFQAVLKLFYRDSEVLFLGGMPGADPFDTSRIDDENGFARSFKLSREGELQPLLPREDRANVQLQGVDSRGRALVTVRSNTAEPETYASLVMIDKDSTTETIALPPDVLKGKQIAAASISTSSDRIVLNLIDNPGTGGRSWQASKTVAFLDGGNARVIDLVGKAVRSSMII